MMGLDVSNDGNSISDFSSIELNNSQWMTSYADIVTVLLCFFILFFNQKDVSQELVDISNSLIAKKEGQSAAEGGTSEFEKNGTQLPMNFVGQLYSMDELSISSIEKNLIVDFKNGSFFAVGSYQLNGFGVENIAKLLETLKPYGNHINIEIQGHSDQTPVSHKTSRKFSSNIELSALRAISVYQYFVENGLPEKSLSISGFGAHRPAKYMVGETHPKEKMSVKKENRRVSFRIEVAQ